jgi:hypothetical protein
MNFFPRKQLVKSGHLEETNYKFTEAIKNSNAVRQESVVVKKPILKLAILTALVVGIVLGMAWARSQEENREYLKASIAGDL